MPQYPIAGDANGLVCADTSSGVRVAYDAGSAAVGSRGELFQCQLPACTARLLLIICIILVICGSCVTLVIGHKFSMDLSLRWAVVCLASFVLSVLFDTIKVCFTA